MEGGRGPPYCGRGSSSTAVQSGSHSSSRDTASAGTPTMPVNRPTRVPRKLVTVATMVRAGMPAGTVSPSWNTTEANRLTAGGVGKTEVLGVGVPDGVLAVAGELEAAAAGELEAAAAGELEAVAVGELEAVVVGEIEAVAVGELEAVVVTECFRRCTLQPLHSKRRTLHIGHNRGGCACCSTIGLALLASCVCWQCCCSSGGTMHRSFTAVARLPSEAAAL